MSDSNMNANAKTEADENKKVAVDESQRPVMPDTDKNDAIPESQRPISPEEDKRRIRAMRGPKCIPDVLRQVLGEATKDHVDTPSEKLVKVAKERDILFDMIGRFGDWFSPLYNSGEDLSFCYRAKELGYEIWCDSRVKCGHMSHQMITEDFYKAFKGE